MSDEKVRVWDLPVRVFHWSVVALVAFQYITAQLSLLTWHVAGGCTMLALVLFRLVWGFIGSDTARFTGFLRWPGEAIRHLARFRSETDQALGHTASGGWAVLAMLGLLCLQVGTGLFADDDIATEGPLGQFVSKATRKQMTFLHARLFWVLFALICLHVTAIAAYRFIKRKDLVTPMFTGLAPRPVAAPAPRMGKLWVAFLIFTACAMLAWKIWTMSDTI